MKEHAKIAGIVIGVLVLAVATALWSWKLNRNEAMGRTASGQPLGEDVAATYVGGEIRVQELRDFINKVTYREGKHEVCEKHGYDHAKCDQAESCETHPLESVEAYRTLLRQLVLERMADRWVKEKGMLSRDDVTHRLKHAAEDLNLEDLAGKLHSDQMKPDQIEMKQYYEEHKDEYQNRAYTEVEKEIEELLMAQKEADYIPKYIEELKQNAVIEKNYELLQVPEPTDEEVRQYYDTHTKEFVRPEAIRIQSMVFRASGSDKTAREKAEKALAKVRAGDDFDAVAKEFADETPAPETLSPAGRSGKSARFLETVFRYQEDEVTPVLEEGGAFYIVRIVDRKGAEQSPLNAVRDEVRTAVYLANEKVRMEEKKYEALFAIHGKRFTVEEFMREFEELSEDQRRQFATFEAKTSLIDQLLVMELLSEKGEDEAQDKDQRERQEEVRHAVLQQMLHKEEVDEKIAISDEESLKFYEEYKDRLIDPEKARISIISVPVGFSDDERKRAKERIEAAQAALRAGTDFAAVAKEYSDDATASAGGEVESWVYEGASHLSEAYEHGLHEQIFALSPGQASDYFEFQESFWIIKMREREEPKPLTFEEAKPRIVALLTGARHDERTYELANELLNTSQLTIRDFVLSRMLSGESKQHADERKLFNF